MVNQPTDISSSVILGDYFGFDAVSASRLKLATKSLRHYFDYTPPTPTPAMQLGTLLHALVLEPDTVDSRFHVNGEKIDRRTKEGKEAAAALAEIEASGVAVVTAEDYGKAVDMMTAIFANPAAVMLTGEGVNELPLTATDPVTGLALKCKIDRLAYGKTGALIPIDVKTTQDASREGFVKACMSYGYAIQAAFYHKVLSLVYKFRPTLEKMPGRSSGRIVFEDYDIRPMRFIMVESSAPHYVGVYELDPYTLTKVSEWIDETLLLIATTDPANMPNPYDSPEPLGLNTVQLPEYYLNKLTTI